MSDSALTRAVRLRQDSASVVEERLALRPLQAGEVAVQIRAAGICHTDAHLRAGKNSFSLPVTLGHEVAGVTESGRRVAVDYVLPGGGMLGKQADGGWADTIIVPEASLVTIPDEISFEEAAIMMCSAATVHHALKLADLAAGERVAILGFGGLGYAALQLARAMGAGEVMVVEQVPAKQQVARGLGALPVDAGQLKDVDIALDLVGNPGLALSALRSLRKGGRLMVIAVNLRSFQLDPYADLLGLERKIMGVNDHTRADLESLMDLARRRVINLSGAITRRLPLEAAAINGALDDLDRGTSHLRSVIVP